MNNKNSNNNNNTMKAIVLFLFVSISTVSFSQLIGGKLVEDGRKMTSASTFKLIDNNVGVVIYELAVNNKGIVTSAKLVNDGTTVISTPTRMKVRNYVMTLKFEEGTYFPEFHHVKVKITVAKE